MTQESLPGCDSQSSQKEDKWKTLEITYPSNGDPASPNNGPEEVFPPSALRLSGPEYAV